MVIKYEVERLMGLESFKEKAKESGIIDLYQLKELAKRLAIDASDKALPNADMLISNPEEWDLVIRYVGFICEVPELLKMSEEDEKCIETLVDTLQEALKTRKLVFSKESIDRRMTMFFRRNNKKIKDMKFSDIMNYLIESKLSGWLCEVNSKEQIMVDNTLIELRTMYELKEEKGIKWTIQ